MKRWIHASRDTEYKTRDYLAAWAKDDVKNGEPVASFRDFKEEMKAKQLKADEDDYDYYVECYNNAKNNVAASTKIEAGSYQWPTADEWYETDLTDDYEMWDLYLGDPERRIEEELQIFPEPSVQAGTGTVFIFDESGDDRFETVKVDFWDWCDKEIELAAESANEEEYKQKFGAWMKELLGI